MLNLFGSPKAGKSFLALGIAEAVTTGRSEFLGIPVGVHGPVCYLQIDTPRGEWLRRVSKAAEEKYDFSKIRFADKESGTPFPFNIITDWPTLKQFLDQIQPILLIVDTLREAFRGDENDSGVMQNVIAHFAKAIPLTCALMLCSHRRKETAFDADDILSSARGSNYISGRMDAVMYLKKKELSYVSRSIELTTMGVFQYRRHSGKSGMIHLDPEETRVLQALETVVGNADEKALANETELGRRLRKELEHTLNGKCWLDKDGNEIATDAFRKQVERKLDRVLYRANGGTHAIG